MKKDKKGEFLEYLRTANGIIKTACARVGISRPTYDNWRKADPDFASKVQTIMDEQADEVEQRLIENIRQGDTTAIIFYLKTKGKNHGYGNLEVGDKEGDGQKPKRTYADAVAMRKLGGIKTGLIRVLKSEGRYSESLRYQIDNVAQLMLRVEELKQEIFAKDHKCVNVETSREGNVRESVSPKERLYLEYLRQMQYALRALGLNMDSKAQKDGGSDGLDEFMKSMKE